MERKHYSVILLLVFTIVSFDRLSGQDIGDLRGLVSDSTNGEVLAGCIAAIEELSIRSITDYKGQFYFPNLPAGQEYSISVSTTGYNHKTIRVSIPKNKVAHERVMLVPVYREYSGISALTQTSPDNNATDVNLERIDVGTLETLPKDVETDIFRSLRLLPGVQTMGDVTGKYFVQGGAIDQNLVMINGITVYNPYHGMGMFSIIDPELINDLDFYKGGFGAEFGSRLSSILNISTLDGNANNVTGKAGISQLSGKALIEFPIPDGSVMLTGRKKINTGVMKKFLNGNEVPVDFYDFSYKLNYADPEIMNDGKILLFGLNSRDEILNEDIFNEDYIWSNNLFGIQWYQYYDFPLYTQFTFASSNFKGEVIPKISGSLEKRNRLVDNTMSFDATYVLSSAQGFGFGGQFKFIKSEYSLKTGESGRAYLDERGVNISFYGNYKYLETENFGLDVGSRINFTGLSENSRGIFFEPRVNITYVAASWIKFKGAWGIYRQELATISDERDVLTVFDPYVIIPEYLDPSTSTHFVLGTDLVLNRDLSFSFEGYFKRFKNLPEINDEINVINDNLLVMADGEAIGGDFALSYLTNAVSLNAAYSYNRIIKTTNSSPSYSYYSRYDSRHSVKAVLSLDFSKGWILSSVWYFNSGKPYPVPTGSFDNYILDDITDNWYDHTNFSSRQIFSKNNVERLPEYHRLDISISKRFNLLITKLYLSLSILNVYDRENVFYYDADTGERINMMPFMTATTLKIEI